VYVLPRRDEAVEDFQWLAREIVAEGGDATLCDASFIEGVADEELVEMFQTHRDRDYAELASAARGLAPTGDPDVELARLERRLDEIGGIDYFRAPGRDAALDALATAEARLRAPEQRSPARRAADDVDLTGGRTWVTREGVRVDRIASAWLVRRFIDPRARIKFAAARGYRPKSRELRFDMYDAEYTHEGDRCTFETLMARFAIRDPPLAAIGEIVHDIDCKETRFGREETAGVASLIEGIVLAHDDDATRLERGALVLDDLYAFFRGKLGAGRRRG
jgi:hypothetical protein